MPRNLFALTGLAASHQNFYSSSRFEKKKNHCSLATILSSITYHPILLGDEEPEDGKNLNLNPIPIIAFQVIVKTDFTFCSLNVLICKTGMLFWGWYEMSARCSAWKTEIVILLALDIHCDALQVSHGWVNGWNEAWWQMVLAKYVKARFLL